MLNNLIRIQFMTALNIQNFNGIAQQIRDIDPAYLGESRSSKNQWAILKIFTAIGCFFKGLKNTSKVKELQAKLATACDAVKQSETAQSLEMTGKQSTARDLLAQMTKLKSSHAAEKANLQSINEKIAEFNTGNTAWKTWKASTMSDLNESKEASKFRLADLDRQIKTTESQIVALALSQLTAPQTEFDGQSAVEAVESKVQFNDKIITNVLAILGILASLAFIILFLLMIAL
jgi:hypothetical protein